MPQPSAVLREAASAASSSRSRPIRFSLNPLGQNARKFRPWTECEHRNDAR